jgi:hypothetical protein
MGVGPVTGSARRPSISAGGGPGIAEREAGVAGSERPVIPSPSPSSSPSPVRMHCVTAQCVRRRSLFRDRFYRPARWNADCPASLEEATMHFKHDVETAVDNLHGLLRAAR